jgi:NAD(P)-dependent dehydrogenase (short-subunit alcohol dehydrogenase family)
MGGTAAKAIAAESAEVAITDRNPAGGRDGACHVFARATPVEFRDKGVLCNAVCPGFIDTPHGSREIDGLTRYGVDVSDATIAMQQGRMGRPDDSAGAVVFLLSDEARFTTGTYLFVDNGFTAV